MKQEEAERLAREARDGVERGNANEPSFIAGIEKLCDHILSGDHKREIENAAFERAAKVASKRMNVFTQCESLSLPDPETGVADCSVEMRGGTCRCGERIEESETIAAAIRALITPAKTADTEG